MSETQDVVLQQFNARRERSKRLWGDVERTPVEWFIKVMNEISGVSDAADSLVSNPHHPRLQRRYRINLRDRLLDLAALSLAAATDLQRWLDANPPPAKE